MSDKNTIFIVDDEQEVRDSLKWLVESAAYEAKTYPDALSFLEDYKNSEPGCLVLDVRMPRMTGLELQAKLIEKKIKLPIVFITGHGDIAMAVRAMKLGAVDFLTKPANHQLLLETINKAVNRYYKDNQGDKNKEKALQHFQQLTPREKEIFAHIIQGKLNKVVAYDLGISVNTVEIHRGNIMRKMAVRTLAELVRMGIQIESELPAIS